MRVSTAVTPPPRVRVDEAELGHALELADVARQLEERVEAGALARPERVAQLLEVAGEVAGRIAVALARLAREHLRLRARQPHRGDERVLELGDAVGDRLRRGPDREHHRQPGPLEPEPAEVVVRRRVLERAPQRRVADQELRVGLLSERHVPRVREQHLREHDRGRALGRHRDRPDLREGRPRDELDRVDGALRRDAQARQDPQRRRVARVLDRRDRREVELAVEQQPVQLGRDALDLLDLGVQPVEDRRHVHVRDAAEPDHRRQLVVERVALHRDPAGIADEADELVDLLLGLGRRAGRVEDLLAHDRALDVVRAEVERDRRERHPHHDPVGLDVRDVVEHQPRDGEHLQVVGAGRVPPAAPLEDRVLRVERERDEGEEAAGLVLLGAQPEQVVDPLLVRLDVAVEHRAVRRDAEPVRRVVGAEPEVGVLLAGRDELAHAVGEDLGAAARQRAEPGGLQLAQHLLVREPGERRHVVDLGRRVELQVHVGQRLLQRADRVDVEVEVDVRVLAVDHVDLGEAGQLVLADRVLDELRRRDRVGLLLLPRGGEGAELALHAADVRLVQVEVLDEVDLVGAAALAPRAVGELAEPSRSSVSSSARPSSKSSRSPASTFSRIGSSVVGAGERGH